MKVISSYKDLTALTTRDLCKIGHVAVKVTWYCFAKASCLARAAVCNYLFKVTSESMMSLRTPSVVSCSSTVADLSSFPACVGQSNPQYYDYDTRGHNTRHTHVFQDEKRQLKRVWNLQVNSVVFTSAECRESFRCIDKNSDTT